MHFPFQVCLQSNDKRRIELDSQFEKCPHLIKCFKYRDRNVNGEFAYRQCDKNKTKQRNNKIQTNKRNVWRKKTRFLEHWQLCINSCLAVIDKRQSSRMKIRLMCTYRRTLAGFPPKRNKSWGRGGGNIIMRSRGPFRRVPLVQTQTTKCRPIAEIMLLQPFNTVRLSIKLKKKRKKNNRVQTQL